MARRPAFRTISSPTAPTADEGAAAGNAAPAPEPQPGQTASGQRPAPRWGGRGAQINLTVSREMKRALALAQVDDGIETTARIRAMIALWQDDPRLAARVAKLAEQLKGRNAGRG